jgi:hypothetical protein
MSKCLLKYYFIKEKLDMSNRITYKVILNCNDEFINSNFINEIKRYFVEKFTNIQTEKHSIIMSNDDCFILLSNSIIVFHSDDLSLDTKLPDIFVDVVNFLTDHGIHNFEKARITLLCRITESKGSNFEKVGFQEGRYQDLSLVLGKTVNAIGLKFSMDDEDWHYEIELLPNYSIGEPPQYLLSLDAFGNSELELKELINALEEHKEFLIEKIGKYLINF